MKPVIDRCAKGGPGNSGIHFLLEFSAYFREVVGPRYDLVSFDPRGKPH